MPKKRQKPNRHHKPQTPQKRRRSTTAKGLRFEARTKRIIERLWPSAKVYPNVRVRGILSDGNRQIDIQVLSPDEYDFLAFECKDYARPLDVPIVEAFATKLRDIRARRGAIVSNSGYTRPARNMAAKLAIDLLELVDTKDPSIRAHILVPTLVRDLYVTNVQLANAPGLLEQLTALTVGGKTAELREVAAQLWNDSVVTQAVGDHTIRLGDTDWRWFRMANGVATPVGSASLTYSVNERISYNQVPVYETEGLYNVHDSTFQTSYLISEAIDTADVATWATVTADEAERLPITTSIEVSSPLRFK